MRWQEPRLMLQIFLLWYHIFLHREQVLGEGKSWERITTRLEQRVVMCVENPSGKWVEFQSTGDSALGQTYFVGGDGVRNGWLILSKQTLPESGSWAVAIWSYRDPESSIPVGVLVIQECSSRNNKLMLQIYGRQFLIQINIF